MQDRQSTADADREIGHLNPEKAYAFSDALRSSVDVGILGLGASGTITRSTSLTTAITIEGFCSLLSLIVAGHEVVNVALQQCCRRDGRTVESTNHPTTQYSTYLFFRVASILMSFVGVGLVAPEVLATVPPVNSVTTTVGLVAMSIGIFSSRALSVSRHKPAGTILQPNDDDIELGLIRHADDAPPPPPVESTPLVSSIDMNPPVSNQFFQPAAAAAAPAAPRSVPEPNAPPAMPPRRAKKGRWVKVKRPK